MSIFWETSFGVFLLVTVILGGGAAYLTGRAVALTWRPALQLVAYAAGLTFFVRFINYALFSGTLLTPWYALVDFAVLLAIGGIGFRLTRTTQMVGQYSWLYERQSPLSWRQRRQTGQQP